MNTLDTRIILIWLITTTGMILAKSFRHLSNKKQYCIEYHGYNFQKEGKLRNSAGSSTVENERTQYSKFSLLFRWKQKLNSILESGKKAVQSQNIIFHIRTCIETLTKRHNQTSAPASIRSENSILVSEQPTALQQCHHSSCYQLTNTECIKRRCFFAYNTTKRPGANEEASNLQKHLEALGFEITEPLIDFRAEELIEELEAYCKKNAKTTSILIVVILAHGSWGRVHDKDDRWIDINEIQEPITSIPHNIPKLLIIQACQGGSVQGQRNCDGGPPRGRLGSSDIHIKDLDMTIMMSTLWGQMSTRNFFVSVLCQVLKEAVKEPLEINDIFRRVCSRMSSGHQKFSKTMQDHKPENQTTPELYSPSQTYSEYHQLPEGKEVTLKLCSSEHSIEEGFTQIPCMISTLRKKLYFGRLIGDTRISSSPDSKFS